MTCIQQKYSFHCINLSRRIAVAAEKKRCVSSTTTTTLNPKNVIFVSETKCTRDNEVIKGTIPLGGMGIQVGQYAQIQRLFTPDEVIQFGQLIGDLNPIHQGHNDAMELGLKKQMVHGMLSGSLFSCIFGTLIPGSIYRTQSMIFQSPIYSNEKVMGVVIVKRVKNMKRRGTIVSCDTNVYKNFDEDAQGTTTQGLQVNGENVIRCLSGEASVWTPSVENHIIDITD